MAKGSSLILSVIVGTMLAASQRHAPGFSLALPGDASMLAADSRLLQTHTLREDFQHDSLGRFASYPPAQDVGYEPSLTPASDYDAPGGRSLMRVWKPNRAGPLRLGFIRQTFLVMSSEARLAFAYRLNHAGSADRIEIGLAGADGCRYVKHVQAGANAWIKTEVLLSDFRCSNQQPLKPGTAIEAVYIIADLKRADADITYRFLIDNIALTAAREARFEVRQPQTIWIEAQNALVSAKSFRAGETVSITVTEPAKLSRVDCTIQDQSGKTAITDKLFDDGTHGDERAGDGRWANSALYLLKPNDPTGIWTIRVRGDTTNGENLATNLRFIYRGSRAPGHPRLYFNAENKEALIDRVRHPRMARLWEKILADAKARRETGELSHGTKVFDMLDRQYLLPSLLAYFDVMNRARLRIEYNALVAYVANDPEARNSAKAALLDVARWNRWEPPWFTAHGQHTYYPAGQLAAVVAFGYDLLYNDMSPEERALVRRALIEKQIIPVYKEYVLDDRVLANTSNWIGHTVGGALIGAAAIAGDITSSESDGQFEIYLNGLLLKMERHLRASYLADGSYGEGISYGEFDLETTGPALVALDRVLGIDYWGQTYVADSHIYPLYVLSQPAGNSPDMGDSHAPTGRTIAPVGAHRKDPTLNWYYAQFPHSSITDLLFPVDSPVAETPQLPTSRIFQLKGNAVFRAGWGKDDPVLLFRAGANFNHNHADQGSFLLTAFGEELVTEAGWSDYYKDPYYATYFTQAIGHNTVLVDGNPESQSFPDTPQFSALDAFPRITDSITGDFYDAVTSDLSSVYGDRLKRYRRSLVFVKPHYFVVFDDLVANGDPATFDWLLHLRDRAHITTSPGLALYATQNASLAVRMLSPEGASMSVRDGRLPYATFATNTPKTVPPQPAFLNIGSPGALGATQFLIALVPARTAEGARGLASRMTRIAGGNFVGVQTERANNRDLVLFRTGATNDPLVFKDWSTDAAILAVTQGSDEVTFFGVQNARSLTSAGRRIFASDAISNIAASYTTNAVDATCNSAAQTKIELFVGRPVQRALVDGREVATIYNQATATIGLTVAAGAHRLKIELR